ncbi:MAG: amylo-alpha-1,6-glucosidase [Phycisphaerae bacterium]|nr:amylo-alpha-1,6-glucosidase [Phycisphaerae bacterium]
MLKSGPKAKKNKNAVSLTGVEVENLLTKEWLLSNNRGSFSSCTAAGVNTRRYHGLLTGSLNPPENRVMSLSCCLETISGKNGDFELSSFEFEGGFGGRGHEHLTGFSRDSGVHYTYYLNWVDVTKSIYILPNRDAIILEYKFSNVYDEFDFTIRPLAAMRSFHGLQKSNTLLSTEWRTDGLAVIPEDLRLGELFLRTSQMWFEKDPQWWYNFAYRIDKRRGQDFVEDLWSPGIFNTHITNDCSIFLSASLGEYEKSHEILEFNPHVAVHRIQQNKKIIDAKYKNDEIMKSLCEAASQFVVQRDVDGKTFSTILAGYPWFMDWGRDAFIALPGLLLCTGNHQQAASVLAAFAGAISEGMIPNRFDDYNGSAHYNSIDASLWFINAAFEYLEETGDKEFFDKKLIPAIRYIVDSYQKSTRFGIHADEDGLISGGDEDTQLTWMDAKFDGVSFTPRYGKAVEINALWYSGLCSLAEYYRDNDDKAADTWMDAEYYGSRAQVVAESFCKVFWNEEKGYLNDCVLPDGTIDCSLRPNQIYAVALPFSPLSKSQQKMVVKTVQEHLLTDYGLRTLSPTDKRYRGRYEGDQGSRDSAYHQGTVWPHLIGPFIEAYLWVNGLDKKTLQQAGKFLEPLIKHINEDGCLGSIAEIFDGDAPQQPKGCFAQAWAVAEVLRSYKMINSKL